jgi:hypothetical protein
MFSEIFDSIYHTNFLNKLKCAVYTNIYSISGSPPLVVLKVGAPELAFNVILLSAAYFDAYKVQIL